ncbi:MAG: hypothetical protein R3B13_12810 [Polyangiaceae bacterium]
MKTDPIPRGWPHRVRVVLLWATLLLGISTFLQVLHGHYLVHYWLIWRYLSAWALVAWMGVACFVGGGAVLGLLRMPLPRAERWLMSFALGVFSWFALSFAGGLLGLFGWAFSLLLPLGMCAIGAPRLWRRGKRLRGAWKRALTAELRLSPWGIALALLAFVGLLLIYVPILTPHNAAADAYWYHLTLAQHNATQGGIQRSVEGSFVAAYPQLATVLYTWAFMLPRTSFFDRVVIAGHMEFLLFLWTLVAVGVLARRVLGRRRIGLTWAAVLLFPGIYLYDSSLSIAADHVLAFWGPPIFLMLLRVWRRFDLGPCIAFAVVASGAVLTKYQAGTLVVFPALALVARSIFLTVRPGEGMQRLTALARVSLIGAVALACTSFHWLKNFVWYGDPFYPMLHARLSVRPWSTEAATYKDLVFADAFWRPAGDSTLERLWDTCKALFTFSFVPHDWYGLHGVVPVFGSLFTLTTVCLPFVRARRRLWGLAGVSYGGLFLWYWVSHQDRYLQAILPLMAATTGALLVVLWQSGIVSRVLASALVVIQIAWGSDVPFIPSHAMLGTTPLRTVIDLASTGYRKDYIDRLKARFGWHEFRPRVPADARVLVHGDLGPLGFGHPIITDVLGWQGGIYYAHYRSPAELHHFLRSLGVTHVVWEADWGHSWGSVAHDLIFYAFARQHLVAPNHVGNRTLARMPDISPSAEPFGLALYVGHGARYDTGLYDVNALDVPGYRPRQKSEFPKPLQTSEDLAALLPRANFVVAEKGAPGVPPLDGFEKIMSRAQEDFWARKRR